MAVMQGRRVHRYARLGVEDDEVGVAARGDRSLAVGSARPPPTGRRPSSRHVGEGEAAGAAPRSRRRAARAGARRSRPRHATGRPRPAASARAARASDPSRWCRSGRRAGPARAARGSRARGSAGALEPGISVGDLLGGEGQIVRAGLDRQRQPLLAGPRDHRQGVGRRQVDDVDAGSPSRGTGRSSAGSRRAPRRAAARPGSAHSSGIRAATRLRSSPISSAWTSSGNPARASSGMTARRSASVTFGNSSIPEWQRNALNPTTPAAIRARLARDARHDPGVEAAIDPELARRPRRPSAPEPRGSS